MITGRMNGWVQAAYMGTQAERRLEVISHNLANTSTIGFKQEVVNAWRTDKDPALVKQGLEQMPKPPKTGEFQLEKMPNQPSRLLVDFPMTRDSKANLAQYPYDAMRPYWFMEMRGADFSQGPSHNTGNETDLALEGPGFFKIETPEGVRYTRDGSFRINNDYQLVTRDGYRLLGKSGPVSVNAIDKHFTVDQEGGVHLDGSLGDQIEIVDFPNPQGLRKQGANLYASTEDSGMEIQALTTKVNQGAIEESNVNPVAGMVELIGEQRMFESMVKTLQTFEECDNKVIREVGRLT